MGGVASDQAAQQSQQGGAAMVYCKHAEHQRQRLPAVRLADYEVLRLVGRGAFGKVYRVVHKATGRQYAMKVLDKADVIEMGLVEHMNLEREITAALGSHPFIVKLHYAFQTEAKLYFILDLLPGGSLFVQLSRRQGRPLAEPVVRFIAAELVLALQCLHSHGIAYRDLKLENVLLDATGHVCLTDFGLSASNRRMKGIKSRAGTSTYIETLLGIGNGPSVDWWALGVMVHFLVTGEPPFWATDDNSLFKSILSADLHLERWHISPSVKLLITGLLTRKVRHRLGCNGTDVRAHPFFTGVDWGKLGRKEQTPPMTFVQATDMDEEVDSPEGPEEELLRRRARSTSKLFRGFVKQESGTSPLSPKRASAYADFAPSRAAGGPVTVPRESPEAQEDDAPDAQVLMVPTKQKRGRAMSQPVAQGLAKVNSSPDVLAPLQAAPSPSSKRHRLDKAPAKGPIPSQSLRSFVPKQAAACQARATYCVGEPAAPLRFPTEKKPAALREVEEMHAPGSLQNTR